MKKLSLLFTFCLLSLLLFAQTSKKDAIYLKNGSIYKGEILKYEQGSSLTLKIGDDQVIVIEEADIDRIVQGQPNTENLDIEDEVEFIPEVIEKEKIEFDYKTEGWYNTTYIAFFAGNDGNEDNGNGDFKLGSGLENVLGKQFSPLLGLGLGIGLDNYSRRGETILPVFAELRGYLLKNGQLYYSLGAGYGFAFKRESFGIRDANGGYMLHPAIGLRLGTPDGTNVNIDLGYKVQKAFFREELLDGDIDERNILFQRLALRVGLTLWR